VKQLRGHGAISNYRRIELDLKRVVANGLHKGGVSTDLVEKMFSEVDNIILYFLRNKK